MALILERLHMLYNDLLTDNFNPLTDETIRNLFHKVHQSLNAFVHLIKLVTYEFEKLTTATNGNIETYKLMFNNIFQEFLVIIKDMVDQSSSRYKEGRQITFNDSLVFNENFISTINFAFTTFQSLMIPIEDPRSHQFRESQDNIILFSINEYKPKSKS
jgi:hypothetical protein